MRREESRQRDEPIHGLSGQCPSRSCPGRAPPAEARDRGKDGITPGERFVGSSRLWNSSPSAATCLLIRPMRRSIWRLRKVTVAADNWFFNAVSSATALSRARTSSASSCIRSGAGARTPGAMKAANCASTRASSRSVFAECLAPWQTFASGRDRHRSRDRGGIKTSVQMAVPLAGRLDRHQREIEAPKPALEPADESERQGPRGSVVRATRSRLRPYRPSGTRDR